MDNQMITNHLLIIRQVLDIKIFNSVTRKYDNSAITKYYGFC
jgi:hypothetical protein